MTVVVATSRQRSRAPLRGGLGVALLTSLALCGACKAQPNGGPLAGKDSARNGDREEENGTGGSAEGDGERGADGSESDAPAAKMFDGGTSRTGSESGRSGGMDAGVDMDGGSAHDAAARRTENDAPFDAAMLDGSLAIGTGSCCTTHESPGCSNADLQVCVCEQLPTCCTEGWSTPCTLIVKQKYCQPGVRECVCGDGQGEWAQTTCCESAWTDFCDDVAQRKCNAVPGCL